MGNFDTIDGFVGWYDYVRPHSAFDVGRPETLAYHSRLSGNRRIVLIDHPDGG
ncbi:hypothetical protein [Conexivisphaera calida]|uniref:Uncharacterized protein n=1 Tax=Conexivisphaera calida TaxID=1874277 RepID=A0A4P2VH96_9ARCH|nr:hypothetical protein [Conexivisphaera calida]BBE42793.1 hypothetical protein NAS2_1406 [Conexivisphaera calida]